MDLNQTNKQTKPQKKKKPKEPPQTTFEYPDFPSGGFKELRCFRV